MHSLAIVFGMACAIGFLPATAFAGPGAVLTSPAPSGTLPGPSATFQWTAPTGATNYTLWLGSTGVGSNNLWGSGATTGTSVTFSALPTNGETIYARLFTTLNGASVHNDYTYTAASAAVLTSPTPGNILPGASATFQWTAAPGASTYTLWLGSTGVGSNNLWGSGATTARSVTFNGLPTNGETIYARLYTTYGSVQVHTDYTYTASTVDTPAALTSPAPGSTLPGTSATFQWTAPAGATAYNLWLGSTGVGSNNLWGSGSTTGTSVTFSSLPTNGETVYARLFTTFNGVTLHTDYMYTTVSAAVLTSPTPTSTLTSASQTFQWTTVSSATQYSIWTGTSVGANNLGYSQGGTTSTSFTLNSLPTNGETIYVRLWTSFPSGGLGHNDYTYKAYTAPIISHIIQISNDADDGYFNNDDNSGWHSDSQYGGADLVGSWGGLTTAWAVGDRFESTGINMGDTIQSAYLELVSSTSTATSDTCGSAPCPDDIYTFRVYGVAQDDGPAFSNTPGNTPLDVPYTSAYVDYTTTGPGDDHGSCQGNNNGQNTCTHTINVTNIVQEITSLPGWTNTSSMRFVLVSTDPSAPNVYAGFEDYGGNPNTAAALIVNPPLPTIVSSGAWGTSSEPTYPTTYATGPFVYPGASTLLLFLGDYYNFQGTIVDQPAVTDSCGNIWNIFAGPADWAGIAYDMRSTVYYVQNPASCPAGDTITVTMDNPEPIFLHFLAVTGSNTSQAPVASAITSPSPGTYTTSTTSDSISLPSAGLLVSWVFGDSDAPHTFTPQSGFITDLNSTPNYLTAVFENEPSSGSFQNQFAITPSADGWQVVLIGLPTP
jgi:hypothetical protein